MLKMRNVVTALAVSAAATLGAASQADAAEFKIDDAHTDVVFMVDHLGYSNTVGAFDTVSGRFTFDPDRPEDATVTMEIDAASLDTGHDERDAHLRSPDFLNVKEFPTIAFTATDVEVTGQKTGTLTGDLTMHGRTNSVTLDVTFNKMAPHPLPQYNEVLTAGFSARGTIRRSKWGVGKYAPLVGDEMKLFIEVEGMVEDGA